MPLTIAPSDRKLVLVAGAALLLLTAAAVILGGGAAAQEEAAFPSTYAAGRGGGKAAYLLLGDMGYKVERWTSPLSRLAEVEQPALLILAEPQAVPDGEERRALHAFLKGGGRVLVTGPLGGVFVPGANVRPGMPNVKWKDYHRQVPSRLTRGAPRIRMSTFAYWQGESAGHIVHYAEGDEHVVVSYPVGEGEVIWWASATPLTNNGIQEGDNLTLFLNSVGAPDTRILWDEYFHEAHHTVFESIWGSPVRWALVQLAFLAGVVVLTYSRRHGPLFEAAPEVRLSPLEFVETLGGLYQRAGATGVALQVASQRFRYVACKRLGLPHATPAKELARAAAVRLSLPEPEVAKALTAGDSGLYLDLSQAEVAALVRQLHRYTRGMQEIKNVRRENH